MSAGGSRGSDATAGVLLAGGHSRRFGREDKVLADLDGKPLFVHALDGLAPAVEGTVVSCRSAQVPRIRRALRTHRRTSTTALVLDPVEDGDPLLGLRSALSAVRATYTVVVAADHPFVDTRFLRRLYARARGRSGAVPQVGGDTKPLQAVYRTDRMAEACGDALEAGHSSLRSALHRLDPVIVPQEEVFEHALEGSFVDVDTRRELELARSQVQSSNPDRE